MDAELRGELERGIKALRKRGKKVDKSLSRDKRNKGALYVENPDHVRDDMSLQFRDTNREPHVNSQGKNIEGYTGRSDYDLSRNEKGIVNREKNEPHP